jgi:hypothetical protein
MDFTLVGVMKDIVSNALVLGLEKPEADVLAFLGDESRKYASTNELLAATASRFSISDAALAEVVERYRHCNCEHVGGKSEPRETRSASTGAPLTLTKFATDVTLHVVLHELGHALIREFDLPVLANEEAMADAFATHFLTMHLPERAPDVLLARVTSLMSEANDVPRAEWSVRGEHDNDARRAFQIAALAVAVDSRAYARVAQAAGLSERDIDNAVDYGAEIHRSWRRLLGPLWMPSGARSSEAAVECDAKDSFLSQLHGSGLLAEIDAVLRRFDWHSQVRVKFAQGDGTAGWNRSARAVTVRRQYLERFIEQGQRAQR